VLTLFEKERPQRLPEVGLRHINKGFPDSPSQYHSIDVLNVVEKVIIRVDNS
jgi:hypothetical protein